ncbi:MAG: trypsin-like peptidase domain-containing protein [Deltaproteobacteria bacterium]|nr:trypsin-like peptidase domain-containing protein [Deltaproteobacteria bacterium]
MRRLGEEQRPGPAARRRPCARALALSLLAAVAGAAAAGCDGAGRERARATPDAAAIAPAPAPAPWSGAAIASPGPGAGSGVESGAGSSAEPPAAELMARLQERIIEISRRVTPSVVHVEAIVKMNDRRSEVTGSGVIASAEGHILTNHHVLEKAEKVQVVVPGLPGKLPARVVGLDKQTDVAVLRVEPRPELVPARFGSAADVQVGQWVLAVGNPYGLDGTVSLGIVSAKGRNLGIPDLINDFIQTDAMIDRGSSGGPLVDLDGRVVGINSRGQGRGIGFTIPIDTALEVMRELEAGGVERGYLGVSLQPLDRELASYFGIPDATGVIVNSVAGGSPAADAGLRTGDILIRFAGQDVAAEKEEDLGGFQRLVAGVAPGAPVELEVLRDRQPLRLHATLAAQPKVEPEEVETEVGFHVQEITEATFREQRLASRTGAYVSFVASGSPAAEAGLDVGDVVQRIEERPVTNLAEFREAIGQVAAAPRFLVTVERGDETLFLLVRPGAPARDDALPAEPGEASHTP